MKKYKLIFLDRQQPDKPLEKVIVAHSLADAYTEGHEEAKRAGEDFWGNAQLSFQRAEAVGEEPKPEPKA
jgi:hypothetical protein